jgi:hypothetical protein
VCFPVMSERKCVKCRRPVAGHCGQTGASCMLTPVDELHELDKTLEELEDLTKRSHSTPTGGTVGVVDVSRKLDRLSDQFERLMLKVGDLTDRVDKSESTLTGVVKASSAVSTVGKHAARADQPGVAGAVGLPKPSWNTGVAIVAEAPVTTQTLARDTELSRLLDEYNNDGTDDLLRAQDAVNASDLGAVRQGEPRVKKPLLIPDFITSCLGISYDQEDIELLTSKGPSFKLQGRTKKVEAKDVSVAQWVSANIAILEQLMPSLSAQELRDYLSYTRQIGDLLQIYTTEAIFTLDNEHRKEVCLGVRRWSDISVHMDRFYLSHSLLKTSGGNMGNANTAGTSSGKSKKNRFNHPCVRFNSREGCDNQACKFQSICSIRGCRGSHPKHEHPVAGQDFRKPGISKEGEP